MVSDFGNTTDFIPLDITNDPLLAPDTSTTTPTNGSTSFSDNLQFSPIDAIGTIGDLISAAEKIVPTLVGLINDVAGSHPLDIITTMKDYAQHLITIMKIKDIHYVGPPNAFTDPTIQEQYASGARNLWGIVEQIAGGPFLWGMLEGGLGLDVEAFDEQGQKGVQTADTMIGFALILQFAVLFAEHSGTGLFGNRWGRALKDTIAKIPEEIGSSWALGIIIEKAFDAAVGESIGNNIRRQKAPNKPEWPIARTMLKQHVIKDADLDDILSDAGYNDHWKKAIKALETQPIPVGDIQALYQNGVLNNDVSLPGTGGGGTIVSSAADLPITSLDYWLIKLGFNSDALNYIKQLYVTKAETSTGAEIRSVWRSLFRNSLVTETEYRDKLKSVNFPQMLIDNDVQAVLDEKQYGWKVQQISVIKSDYLHHPGTQSTAVQKLQVLGYSHTDAVDMVNAWTAPLIPRHRGLTAAQILKFYAAGITLSPSAHDQLLALGYDSDTTTFMLAHPYGAGSTHIVKLTPGLVIQAFLDGAIQQDSLRAELEKAGAKGDVQDYYFQTAMYRYARHHTAGSGKQPLTEGDIKEAFKIGLWDFHTALGALEGLGYSQANATLILEIVNKGPIVPPPQPAFASVGQAISFLEFLGITIEAPIDSTYESAISMIEQAGYTPVYPANFVVPRTGATTNVGA